ncbi:MAG: BatA domain-containing protein [Planctomycetes bacterium]|nr:BatA domain-containing protein [Planctomycetota bacterium]MBI3833080.1 BatA domain-containing protein [Planctomycetota bacterium]
MVLSQLMLAAFITPGLALAGGIAVASPIIIHLLARRRFKRIRWAAMDFLLDAERRNRRRIRMEEWLLLALRCAAVLLVGLMLARPFLSAAGFVPKWAGAKRVERVLILDDSFSMGYESPDATSFSRAKEALHRLIEIIRSETPDDSVTVIRTSAASTPVNSGAFLNDTQTADLYARIDPMTPSMQSMDLRGVFQTVTDGLGRDPGIVNAVVYLISDFQRINWSADSASGTALVSGPLSDWASKNRNLRAVLVNIGDESASNLAITDARWSGGPIVAGASASIQVTAANYSNHGADPVELHATAGGRAQASKSIRSLPERQSTTVDVDVDFPRIGDEVVRIDLPADALAADNTRFAAADVVGAVRILIVNGEPSSEQSDDEVMLLSTALHPEGPVFSGHEVTVTDEAGLEDANLSSFHLVILANVYRPGERAVQSLENYVRGGGGLLVFLGDQVDASFYNSELYRVGEGLLPAELQEVVGAPDAVHLAIVDRLHPALRSVSRENDPLGISQIPFYGYYTVAVPVSAPPEQPDAVKGAALPSSKGPDATAKHDATKLQRPPSNIIATFSDPDGHPAILERVMGEGRVMLIASSADKEWNLWPYHPTYVPIMTEFARHLARRTQSSSEVTVGSPIVMPIDASQFQPEVIVRGPRYPNEAETAVTAASSPESQELVVRWDHTDAPGVYQFVLRKRDGGEAVRMVPVNLDARESDLSMVNGAELRREMGAIPFEYIQGLANVSRGADDARAEFWRPALIAAIIMLMSEQFLAWRWGRKR